METKALGFGFPVPDDDDGDNDGMESYVGYQPNHGMVYWVGQDRFSWLLQSPETQGQLAVALIESPGLAVNAPAHVHTNDAEILITLEGTLRYTVAGGAAYEIQQPASLLFLPPGVAHAHDPNTGFQRNLLVCVPGAPENYFHAISNRQPAQPLPEADVLAGLASDHGITFIAADAPVEQWPDSGSRPVRRAPKDHAPLSVLGTEIWVLLKSAETESKVSVVLTLDPPHAGPPLHRHLREAEFFYVLAGEYILQLDGAQCTLRAGDSAWAPAGSIHTYKCIGNQPGQLLVVATPGGLDEFFTDLAEAAGKPDFSPETGAAVGARHQIEFLGPPL